MVAEYNKYMLGVDKLDQLVSYYSFPHKSLKWWRKVFFWLVEVAVVNSYVIYKEQKLKHNERPITHLAYQRSLIDMLTKPVRSTLRCQVGPRVPPTEKRLQDKPHFLKKDEKRTECIVCSDRKEGQHILHISIVVHVLTILLYAPPSASKYTTHKRTTKRSNIP